MINKLRNLLCVGAMAALVAGCASHHKRSAHVSGKIVGTSYISPRGGFTVPFPVSREIQGKVVRDDDYSVTFHDSWGSKISFYSHPVAPHSPMERTLDIDGTQKALETLCKDIYGNLMVMHFHPDILGGTLSFVYLKPVGPKTGVACFIHNKKTVYLVETDLLPAVQVLSKPDDASQASDEKWLENRAVELLQTMQVQ